MNHRLPPRPTEWIDRDKVIHFQFEGTGYHGYAGDVLSSALWANNVRIVGRSFKYHRTRGIYSLANHDANAMFCTTDRTNIRGDCHPLCPGLDLSAVNTVGGLYGDRMRFTGLFSRFLPVGFYYKAFHTPRRLFPLYERFMRNVAGLGKVNPGARTHPTPKAYAFCDVAVVGSGPAGISAALAAADAGATVMLVEEQPHVGGSLYWQWGGDPQGGVLRDKLLTRLNENDRITVRRSTQAGGWYADHLIALCDEHRLTKLRARATIVATGCFEQPAVFQNNDLPGCMLASAAQRLIHQFAVRPFDRCVVLAANTYAYQAALDLLDAGSDVAAIVDLRPDGEQSTLATAVQAAGVDILVGHAIYEATPAVGHAEVAGVHVCPLDGSGQPDARRGLAIACHGVAVSVGWAPAAGLLYQAKGRLAYDRGVEQFVPAALPDGIFAAGRVNGIFDLNDQVSDGRRAGLEAMAFLGCHDGTITQAPGHTGPPPSHPYPIFAHPGKKNFVDFDEDIHLEDFKNAHQEGYDNIELIKRYTTVGMGPSQGKLSNMNAVRILAHLNGAEIDATGTTTSRPFHHPVSLGHLAGRRFHPTRTTPMHSCHQHADAHFIYAGTWLRPEYYRREGLSRAEIILDEARRVRHGIGMIDVGTLGKIHIRGPDTTAFIERLYTGRFAKQKIGTARYCLGLDETGVIIEDGVATRCAEDHYYITATSSGAAAFYREMQRWAMLWKMQVTLHNATGHLAAMNVAGPVSRQILSRVTDLDLSREAMPYLAVRHGEVAGVPALVMRVGFVGELGFEVHVPASTGRHVWDTIMAEGRDAGIAPFGVEAQRLLRLEKGHIIVSQDTDALTTPREAAVSWAVGKNKPFFVGQRSLQILDKRPQVRMLVGLRFENADEAALPLECHLIIEKDQMVGRITSVAHRTTLGVPLALAFVHPDLAQPGRTVMVHSDHGRQARGTVVPTPFYDPRNLRQQL